MDKQLGINPWLSIWVKPRKTIQSLIQYHTNYRFILLCAIYGFQHALQSAQYLSLGRNVSLIWILLISLIISVPIGYVFFNFSSAFLFWIGKLIKGKGTFKQVRAATYWSSVPNIATLAIWALLIITHGSRLFIAGYEGDLSNSTIEINIGASVLQIILGIWMIVIFLHALGEVQGFSAWMALLNAFLSGLTMFFVMALLVWGVSEIMQLM